jgi:hypothetical protein
MQQLVFWKLGEASQKRFHIRVNSQPILTILKT